MCPPALRAARRQCSVLPPPKCVAAGSPGLLRFADFHGHGTGSVGVLRDFLTTTTLHTLPEASFELLGPASCRGIWVFGGETGGGGRQGFA